MTTVVNIKFDQYDQYIGRTGHGHDGYFGNPFILQPGEPKGSTLEKFRIYFYNRIMNEPEFKRRVLRLKNKRLGCFCSPNPCHGDIYKEYKLILCIQLTFKKKKNHV